MDKPEVRYNKEHGGRGKAYLTLEEQQTILQIVGKASATDLKRLGVLNYANLDFLAMAMA